MKRTFTALIAITLCGGLGLFWFKTNRPNSDLPSQYPQSETRADSTTLPSNQPESVSKTESAPSKTTRLPAESPTSRPTLVQFIFDETTPSPSSPGQHTHIIQEWKGQFSPRIQDLSASFSASGAARQFNVQLPDGNGLEIEIIKNTQFDQNRGVFIGRVIGSDHSEAIFSYVNQAVSGSITMPQTGEILDIKNAGEGYQYLAQVDANKLGSCGLCAPHNENEEL
ncbi:MAG: hypothetical protein ACI92G_001179 [Candidatus Pelagisphaera sp.]|jgi:hypothetical protein